MNTQCFIKGCLFFLCIISFASCQKEEDDLILKEIENATVIQGTVLTAEGKPLAGIDLSLDYNESAWLSYTKVRHKAKAKTDKNGHYKLLFYVQDDELKKVESLFEMFYLKVDLQSLDAKQYMLPADMSSIIASVEPLVVKPNPDEPPLLSYTIQPQRDTTYMQDFYIPQKRILRVTLKGFTPELEEAYFEVSNHFPWGGSSDQKDKMIDTKYEVGNSAYQLYISTSKEQTFEIPFALNEQNTIQLMRNKNGEYTRELYPIFVTKDSPQSLTFEY